MIRELFTRPDVIGKISFGVILMAFTALLAVGGFANADTATISGTGYGSNNNVSIVNNSNTSVTTSNNVNVSNTTTQSSSTGSSNVSNNTNGGSATSGNATNSSSTTSTVIIQN